MTVRFLRFNTPRPRWSADRTALCFEGDFDGDVIQFSVTARALADLLGPDARFIREEDAVGTFREAESALLRYAHREWSQVIGKTKTIAISHETLGD